MASVLKSSSLQTLSRYVSKAGVIRFLLDLPTHCDFGEKTILDVFFRDNTRATEIVLPVADHRFREIADVALKGKNAPQIPVAAPNQVYRHAGPRRIDREKTDLFI